MATRPIPPGPGAIPSGGGRVIPFPVQTCTLVKPGDRDPYAELLASVPDLVPPRVDYDAMQGLISPEVQHELGHLAEVREAVGAGDTWLKPVAFSSSHAPQPGAKPIPLTKP